MVERFVGVLFHVYVVSTVSPFIFPFYRLRAPSLSSFIRVLFIHIYLHSFIFLPSLLHAILPAASSHVASRRIEWPRNCIAADSGLHACMTQLVRSWSAVVCIRVRGCGATFALPFAFLPSSCPPPSCFTSPSPSLLPFLLACPRRPSVVLPNGVHANARGRMRRPCGLPASRARALVCVIVSRRHLRAARTSFMQRVRVRVRSSAPLPTLDLSSSPFPPSSPRPIHQTPSFFPSHSFLPPIVLRVLLKPR
ncbi:hypothetical protein B0H16DRAFT_1895911 [Mycena metata]|uniref:Uncharacterized protein n=1 Tax=Mycena metata TaxID=1033252 RepID=A0AAD7HL00_9AGAR|nr:hypothetical protein B0H16DRAFT_1895911 [Mycena metata]